MHCCCDLNGDGLNDLLTSAGSKASGRVVSPALGQVNSGSTGDRPRPSWASRCEAADLDGDGDLDVLASAHDGNKDRMVNSGNDGALLPA
ncbi:MAG: VCBS repeat-containing protein [Flavobacteriales bacterium]|nr:VCBS repeat-containing protein [Flavobacteriales bacterium]